jgi:hypothetical protein
MDKKSCIHHDVTAIVGVIRQIVDVIVEITRLIYPA